MNWSLLPRRTKAMIITLGALIIVVIVVTLVSLNAPKPKADVATSTSVLDNQQLVTVLFKATDEAGNPVHAFVDAFYDTNNNCTIDADETEGFTGETMADDQDKTDGTVALNLPTDQVYMIRALAQDTEGEANQAIALGNPANAASCAEVITAANTDPIVLKIKK